MRTSVGSMLSLALTSVALAASGCAEMEGGMNETDAVQGELETVNGLATINGLSTTNGLGTINGLSTTNGLATINGLSTTNGLMTTIPGRKTVEYLARCALKAGTSMVKKDQNGVSYTYQGQFGLGQGWQYGSCDEVCQEQVTACMLAHINTAGVHIPLWIVAQPTTVGWNLSPDYPKQEGSFFGNIFKPGAHGAPMNKIPAFYCNGIAFDQGTVPGRIGANQTGAPYTDPFPGTGYCKDTCTPADTPYAASGYKACNGWNKVLTVWRK
jgi:hypothetical protein